MAIGSGIGSQLGIASETTYNTYATVNRFLEFNSESLEYNKKINEGLGLRAGGSLPRSSRRVVSTFDVTGDIALDLPTRGLGLLLAMATGTVPSPTTVTTGVYSYTYTLGDPYGKSFSAQVGVPQYGGTVTPKTITGAKVASFDIEVSQAGLATGKFAIDAAGFTTSQSLATATYSSTGSIFHFAQGAITVDGTSVANVKDFSVSVDNTLKVDRYNLGASGAKAEQTNNGFRKVTGKLTAEFTDTAFLAKYLADSATALVLTFTGNTITGTYKDTLSITLSAVKFDGDTPKVDGPGVIDVEMTFTAYDNGTDAPLTIVYQTSESTL